MQNRRTFIKKAMTAAGAVSAAGWSGGLLAAESTRSVLVFDAMGENVRRVYAETIG